MHPKIIQVRLWLAQKVAPAGAIHDVTDCSMDGYILDAVFSHWVRDDDKRTWMDVTELLDDLVGAGLVDRWPDGQWKLTDHGEQKLAVLWGPDRMPPWSAGFHGSCDDHGLFDCHPGDLYECPSCGIERGVANALRNLNTEPASWWSRRRLARASR